MRIFIYSHDTYGLGHLRRCMIIAREFLDDHPENEVLIATGSPRATAFDWPSRCSGAVLPAILKQPDGTYRSRDCQSDLVDILVKRAEIIGNAFRQFRPHAVLVDHAPLGVENELVPLLAEIERSPDRPVLIFGMRDIADEKDRVREQWQSSGAMDAIKNSYDRVLIYGASQILTTAVELGIGKLVDSTGTAKTRHVGYVSRPQPKVNQKSGRLLITAGGGGDGHPLLRKFLEFLARHPDQSLGIDMVTGPFLSPHRLAQIEKMATPLPHDLEIIRFDPQIEERVRGAKGVIAMAGYNSVVEILAAGCPGLLVPRETPRQEQLIRAQRIAENSGLQWCRASDLSDDVITGFFASLDRSFKSDFDQSLLTGAAVVVQEIKSALGRVDMPNKTSQGTGDHLRENAR